MSEELEPGAAAEADRLLEQNHSMLSTLDRVIEVMTGIDVPYLFIGGLASATHGRYRHTADIDILVHPGNARQVLDAFSRAGFDTEETFPHWLFKARQGDEVVDILFSSQGEIYLDAPMLAHSTVEAFEGRKIHIVSPEDLIVMKALAHGEATPRHWFDALGILGRRPIDWDYLIERARRGPWRVISLLAYARSSDLPVPDSAMRELMSLVDSDSAP